MIDIQKTESVHTSCVFCDSAKGGASRPWYDIPLFESTNFSVVPSVGALVPGWLLVAPKAHVLSVAKLSLSDREELRQVVGHARDFVERAYGQVTIFEHGANAPRSLTGCGLDHAHVHIVPLPFSLLEVALADSETSWAHKKHGPEFVSDEESDYLLISERSGDCFVGHRNSPTSQYFRRLIAARLGYPDRFDYRSHRFLDNVRSTVDAFFAQRVRARRVA